MMQATALKAMKLGYNIFLTGAAGSGKTFVLNQYIEELKEKHINVAVTASTGIAATHLNGITIHAWSGMGVREELTEVDFKKIGRNARVRSRLKKAKVLIIDEVSMLHAHQLDMIDAICRRFIDKRRAFGGLQVILCGDFFQLPPIEKSADRPIVLSNDSAAWRSAHFKICYLSEQHRQKTDSLVEVLNSIRQGAVTASTIELLTDRVHAELGEEIRPTRLYSHNHEVNAVNDRELGKIISDVFVYEMRSKGSEQFVTMLKSGCLAPPTLSLKKGARVMFVKNNFDKEYVNGTLGVIEDFEPKSRLPIVRTFDGRLVVAEPETWAIGDDETVLASIRQIPLRLAWAITIHKSQGMSLDAAEIDLRRSFVYGMGYVALSRVRSLAGMRLLGLNEQALLVDPKIMAIDHDLQVSSAKLALEMERMSSKRRKTVSSTHPDEILHK